MEGVETPETGAVVTGVQRTGQNQRQSLGKTYVFQYYEEETEVRTAPTLEGVSTQLRILQGSGRRHSGRGAERGMQVAVVDGCCVGLTCYQGRPRW